MKTSTLERTVFWRLPVSVLLVAYAGLCLMTGTVWPWGQVVHEDGVRTLLGTVFYVEHAARELVPDLVLAVAVAGAVHYYFPPSRGSRGAGTMRWRWWLRLVTAAMLAGIVGGTLWSVGAQALIDNLSQLHTRAGAPLVWGAHWRYHLIERFAQIMLAFSATGVIWMMRGTPGDVRPPGRLRLYATALALFTSCTAIFGLTSEPFRDPAFLGHQLRELFTHTLVTLPLALGVCLTLARTRSPGASSPGHEPVWPIVVTGCVAVVCGVFLLVASVLTDAQSQGQAAGLAALLFPHFAEHAMGYVLVPAMAGAIYSD